MSTAPATPPDSGTRDCGRFFLDLVGQFAPDHVTVRWTDRVRPSDAEVDELIERTWREQTAEAKRTGKDIFDGPLCRLIGFEASGAQLALTLGPVSFREFLGTNATQAHIRHLHGPEVLADPVGISAALTTDDGFLLLGQRSGKVVQHAGRLHPIGGMMTPAAEPPDAPDPFGAMFAELREEMAVTPAQVREAVCIGLVRDKHTVQPELIFDIAVKGELLALLEGAGGADDAYEHSALVPVQDHPAAMVTFIEQHFAELTSVAMATLLLHGLRHWGSGWFASARGYLCSII